MYMRRRGQLLREGATVGKVWLRLQSQLLSMLLVLLMNTRLTYYITILPQV